MTLFNSAKEYLNSILNYISSPVFNDAPLPWQYGFQDSAAPGFTGLVTLHNTIGFYLIVIFLSVGWVLLSVMYYYSENKNPIAHKYLTHGTVLELIWTITPALILIAIAFPSFRLLYLMDEVISPTLTIKVVGHQWYWSYEYSDFITETGDSIDFDSYMLPADWCRKSIAWAQLPNSGDALKIVVPSHNGNVMSGQNNYLGTVTSYDMNESEMGNRGSKSSAIALVKEQRVDGSYSLLVGLLRCTLMAPVRGYQTEILSNKNNISENVVVTKRPNLNKLDPWFITGFVDAEGCFSIELYKDSKAKFKYTPRLVFTINLHVKDLPLLLSFKNTCFLSSIKEWEL